MNSNTKSAHQKRVPVPINPGTYAKLKAYSDLTGIPIARVVDEAANDWLDTIGQARQAYLLAESKGDLLQAGTAVHPVPGAAVAASS